MVFPWTDWQFWVVTLIAAWCTWIVCRQLLPREKGSVACGACAAGAAACAKHSAPVERPLPSSAEAEPPPLVVLSPRRRDKFSAPER